MLGCTCTIHLGIQWPRIRCSRAYAQHQHGRLQGLCPTYPIIFSCVPNILTQHKGKYSCVLELLAQHKGKYSCAPEFLAQHKSSITQVLQSSSLNINHQSLKCSKAPHSAKKSHQSCASGSTPNTKKHIHISSIIGLCSGTQSTPKRLNT